MNRLGIQSLHAGAPDLRLSGDQTQRGTYTQRRRAQMAGGGIMGSNAGSMLVAPTADGSRPGYGVWDKLKRGAKKIKDKFVDDIIPNELKNPAVLATLAGVGINQFGLPNIPGMGKIGLEKGMGQNWYGELLGNVVPGGTVDMVLGQGGSGQTLGTGMSNIWDAITGTPTEYSTTRRSGLDAAVKTMTGGGINSLDANWQEILKQQAASKLPGMIAGPVQGILDVADRGIFDQYQNLANIVKDPVGTVKKSLFNKFTDTMGNVFSDTTRGDQTFNWKIPVAGGLAAGAYTAAQPRDTLPMDETGINFQTAEQAMADEDLRFKPETQYALAADGGRIGYNIGGITGEQNAMVMDMLNKGMDNDTISTITGVTPEDIQIIINQINEAQKGIEESGALENVDLKAQGGRIGYRGGKGVASLQASAPDPMDALNDMSMNVYGKPLHELTPEQYQMLIDMANEQAAMPGRDRVMAQEGGLMDLGGMEKDYRQEGGFVPIGGEEKADDVPARLSKNEFVFTADAVRSAGGGDIDEGAAVMERLMENLEAGGEVSEDSQGLEGARGMFANTQRLQNRII